MRHRILTVPLAAFIAAACQPASSVLTDAQRETITAEVNQVVVDLFDAMNAHEADRVLEHYLNSDEFAYVGLVDIRTGWNGFARMAGQWYPANPDVTFEYQIAHTQVLSPTVALVVLRGSSTDAEALVWTQVMVNHDGQWRIAHEHESWPQCIEAPKPHPMTVPGGG